MKTVLKFGGILGVLVSLWRVRFNRVYFTSFRVKVWKILIFEWILLLKQLQRNCKYWVCKEKLVELSMRSHLGQRQGYTSDDLSILSSFLLAFFLPNY